MEKRNKSKALAVVCALLFGGIGIHKFYLGRWIAGLVYLAFCWTMVPVFLSFFDAVVYLFMPREIWIKRYSH